MNNERCVCTPDICFGVPGDGDGPQKCAPCLALDPEWPCINEPSQET